MPHGLLPMTFVHAVAYKWRPRSSPLGHQDLQTRMPLERSASHQRDDARLATEAGVDVVDQRTSGVAVLSRTLGFRADVKRGDHARILTQRPKRIPGVRVPKRDTRGKPSGQEKRF